MIELLKVLANDTTLLVYLVIALTLTCLTVLVGA